MNSLINMLIVDDNSIIANSLVTCFGLDEHFNQLHVAKNGIEALDFLSKQSYDVVLCDDNMPQMNGWQFIQVCKQKFPLLPIYFLPDVIDTKTYHSLAKNGVIAVGIKSSDPDEIITNTLKLFYSQN